MVVTSPQTGEVNAIVGGRQRVRRLQPRARRAPADRLAGKPPVYLAALESGRYTPRLDRHDAPIESSCRTADLDAARTSTARSAATVPLVRALAESLNLATVHLGLDVGLERVARTLRAARSRAEAAAYPSMLLGALDLTPIEVAQIYNTLANGGFRVPLRAVRAVLARTASCSRRRSSRSRRRRRRTPSTRSIACSCEVMERGTGRPARKALPAGPRRRGQDRHVERLARQLVRGLHGRAPGRRVDGPRRQLADRAHGHDRRARGVVEADVVDHDLVVRAADAGVAREPLDRLLLGPRDVAVLRRRRGEPAVPDRHALPAKRRVSAGRGGCARTDPAAVPEDAPVPAAGSAARALISRACGPDNRRPCAQSSRSLPDACRRNRRLRHRAVPEGWRQACGRSGSAGPAPGRERHRC